LQPALVSTPLLWLLFLPVLLSALLSAVLLPAILRVRLYLSLLLVKTGGGGAPKRLEKLILFALDADLNSGEPFEHLDDRRAVFFVEPLGAAHLVDLLRQVGEEERHPEPL